MASKSIGCSLNDTKDKELLDYLDSMSRQGYNNSVLIKIALYSLKNSNNSNLAMINQTMQTPQPPIPTIQPTENEIINNESLDIVETNDKVIETITTKEVSEPLNQNNNVLPTNFINKFHTTDFIED